MAASEVVQELIRSHVNGDEDRFRTIALQLAATEARLGHRLVAGRIRDLLESGAVSRPPAATPLARPPADLRALLDTDYPKVSMRDIVLDPSAEESLTRVLTEQRSRSALAEWGLEPRRKILLYGPPGCGKTLTAQVLAGELGMPLVRVRVEVLFSRFLGETALLLTEVFAEMQRVRGVFLFDEFDAIGRHRGDVNDVGEAKRVVSTFLQLLDADQSDSLVVAATNEVSHLDAALFRRFDDVIHFGPPSQEAIAALLRLRTSGTGISRDALAPLAMQANGLSFAEVASSVEDAMKGMVLAGRKRLTPDDLRRSLERAKVGHPARA
jgi:SpoVK/Ycf46/Vps4 family AAA+-type ATPase